MDDRSFFDNLAEDWDAGEILSTPEKVDYILDFLKIQEGQSILDLGTGTGVLLPYIGKRIGSNGTITAVDFSTEMLKRARQKFSGITPHPVFLNIDFEKVTIEGEYDRIILYCVYPHLHEPIDTIRWLVKVNLRPDGRLYIAFPTGHDFINNIHKERHSESGVLPNAENLAEFFNENGLNAQALVSTEGAYVVEVRR